jgi:N-acetylglutamate synthase-like GNAT family acetyltransferase
MIESNNIERQTEDVPFGKETSQEMLRTLKIRKATPSDLPTISSILSTYNLPLEGVQQHLDNFLVAEAEGTIIGTIGIEHYNETGLLRSAAVSPQFQNKGIGDRLVNTMIEYAKEKNIKEIYLLTETAEKYFEKKGFSPIDRAEVKGEILTSVEFTTACCTSKGVCMKRTL